MAAVDGENSLQFLKSADLALYLAPSSDISRHARIAARHLYSSLLPFCPNPKPPLDELLVEPSFDAEQIWGQIDLVNRPVLSMLRREIKKIERNPPVPVEVKKPEVKADEEDDHDDDDDDEVEEEEEEEEEEEGDDEEEEEEGEEESDDEEERVGNGVEDGFLKINELEEYLEKDEEREFGQVEGKRRKKDEDDDDEEDDDEDEDGDDDENELGDLYGDGDDGFAEQARYGDFFGGKKQRSGKKKDDRKKGKKSSMDVEFLDEPEELDLNEELNLDDEQKDDTDVILQNGTLSTHEKQLLKMQSKIEQIEKESLEPKDWTMLGEVTAAKRPKNSALEVDLDFEHNMRPPPVVTEELTASLEDLIKKRIVEGQFDDVQRVPALPTKPPKELKELDENKSKKGLAEIYEEEYAQTTGLASAPLSSSDEQKKEATTLFKKLCLKLDALSHFHFAPKPVIEDMSIQANVPALAMEEIAPTAMSDAAMLAPEEIFKGKGDVKDEVELTQAERKRRRANKKRKYKAETAKREGKRAHQNAASRHSNDAGKEHE